MDNQLSQPTAFNMRIGKSYLILLLICYAIEVSAVDYEKTCLVFEQSTAHKDFGSEYLPWNMADDSPVKDENQTAEELIQKAHNGKNGLQKKVKHSLEDQVPILEAMSEKGDIQVHFVLARTLYHLERKKNRNRLRRNWGWVWYDKTTKKSRCLMLEIERWKKTHPIPHADKDKMLIDEIIAITHPDDFNPTIEQLYRNAAENGHWKAKVELAYVLTLGIGVMPDPIEAYAWLYTAATENPPFGSIARDRLASALTKEELARGRRKGEEFIRKFTKIWDRPSVVIIRGDQQFTED